MKISLKEMTLVSLFTALMVVGAFVRIPLPGLPVTLQPFFCAFAGMLLGSRLGLTSQLLYMLMGLVGIPVFTKGGGIGYIFEPSFGYILGFAAGAYVIGKLSETAGRITMGSSLRAVLIGLAVIYAIGVPYTYLILKFYLHTPGVALVSAAIAPYFIKDLILFILIAVTAKKVVPLVRRSQTASF